LGFSPVRVYPRTHGSRLQLLAILKVMDFLPYGIASYLIYLSKRVLGWRDEFPLTG
jgi:hypothetical protein